jgi:hypothetical protein
MQIATFSMKYYSWEVFKDEKPRTIEQVFGKK